ncbi:MAG: Ig-like domain repeat protein [Acidobacteriaceae bacterium]|nr:Ig-like domain repeat protein [Acidobacteriaceae bacterium]
MNLLVVFVACGWANGQTLPSAPSGSSFTPPAADACQSLYDRFYMNEPGVYAFWGLCEYPAGTGQTATSAIDIYDYAGGQNFGHAATTSGVTHWEAGNLVPGVTGPVGDGETGMQNPGDGNVNYVTNMGMLLNNKQGTVATWIIGSAWDDASAVPAIVFSDAVHTTAGITIGVGYDTGTSTACFSGDFTESHGAGYTIRACNFDPAAWHRVVYTWNGGTHTLYVDGVQAATGTYSGNLFNDDYNTTLFDNWSWQPPMSLAKTLVANEAWSADQVAADFAPAFPTIPTGGVYIDASNKLGTIHKDVLGYADVNQDISTADQANALTAGMGKAGVTSLRYANSFGGLNADWEDWQTGQYCKPASPGPGTTGPSGSAHNLTGGVSNGPTNNSIDTYLPIAQALGLDVGFTVNYGSNPACTSGGDPTVNGANLVTYANSTKGYGIKYWEIGNEQYSDTTMMDLNSDNAGYNECAYDTGCSSPASTTPSTYATHEPGFYTAMKAVDSSIKIGIPVAFGPYYWNNFFSLPAMANASSYDAVVFHNYPMKDPISDGDTLYNDRVTANASRVRGGLKQVQTALLSAGKTPDSIWVTEWNGQAGGDKWSTQTLGAVMPLFATQQLAEYMRAGVQYATWWAQGETGVCSPDNFDTSGNAAYNWYNNVHCGNGALVYTGQKSASTDTNIGMQKGDITPAARAFQLLSESGFVTEGESMLETWNDMSGAPWLLSYAATHGTDYGVILINRDQAAHTVPVTLTGKDAGIVALYTYGKAQYDQSAPIALSGVAANWEVDPATSTDTYSGGSYTATLPPWSVTVLMTAEMTTVDTSTSVNASPTQVSTGSSTTLTATVTVPTSAGTAPPSAGTVTFSISDGTATATIDSVAVSSSGVASTPYTPPAAGTYTVTAAYSGGTQDATIYNASDSTALPVTVEVGEFTVTATAMTASPPTATVGDEITLAATVSDGTATPVTGGTVTFTDTTTGTQYGPVTVTSGAASTMVNTLTVGTHDFTAAYSGDGGYAGSDSTAAAPASVTISAVATTTAISNVSPAAPTAATPISVTVTVVQQNGGTGVPTGTVTFKNNGSPVTGSPATATLSGGAVTVTFPAGTLPTGSNTLEAAYSGDSTNAVSTGSATVEVTSVSSVATQTALTATPPSSVNAGDAIGVTVKVSQVGASGIPGGAVAAYDGAYPGGSPMGTPVALDANGMAALSIDSSSMSAGTHTITLVYSGDSLNSSSQVSFPVDVSTGLATITSLTFSPAGPLPNQVVTFTAVMTPTLPDYAGTVTFLNGTTVMGTGYVVNGQATYQTSSLAAGTYIITAQFNDPTGTFAPSTSDAATVSVGVSSLALSSDTQTAVTVTNGTGTLPLTIAPQDGYQGTAMLGCQGLPQGMSCSFTPYSLTFDSSGAAVGATLTISTYGACRLLTSSPPMPMGRSLLPVLCILLPGLFGGVLRFRRKGLRQWKRYMAMLLIVAAGFAGALAIGGCGGGASSCSTTTPAGTYNITVTATNNGNVSQFPVTVTVQ